MAGYVVLQKLLLAVVLLSLHVCAQEFYFEPPHHGVSFPKEEGTVNRRVEHIPLNPNPARSVEVRVRNRPPCSEQIDPANQNTSPCIRDAQYDENVQRLITQRLTESSAVNEVLVDPILRVIFNDSLTPIEAPSTRFGGPRESPVCEAQEELIFPQRAKTPKDDWVFVVNQPDMKQALRVEKCIGDGRPCNIGIGSSRDVSTVCRQKYVYRRMLVLGSNKILPEEVLMPSCCVCYTRRENFDISTRININGNSTTGGNPEDPNPNAPTAHNAQPAAPILFQPQNPSVAAALIGNRAHMTSIGNRHTPVRRGAIQRLHPFQYQVMRYR